MTPPPPASSSAARAAALASPHVVELLAPLFDVVPLPVDDDESDDVAVYAVTLQRSGDDWLQLAFPELSRPGRLVAVDVACVDHEARGGCQCDFVRLLRSVLVLTEKQLLRVTAKYVVTTTAGARLATLQLFVALHERASRASLGALHEFDLVLSHLQAGLMAVKATRDGHRIADTVEKARHSKCHVVGCDLHLGDTDDLPAKFSLDEVFHRLTTHVEVEQMPIRDDETYVARMKRAKCELLLTDLPTPALHTFIRMLGARDLAAVSAVCTTFQHLAYEVVPGLKLLLYSHQRKGLRWLLYREGSSRHDLRAMPHPYVFPTTPLVSDANPQDEDADARAIDLIEGRLVRQDAVSPAADFRGGLFCDEPGLGKTITMLALILRTKGQRTDPRTLEDAQLEARRKGVSLRSSGSRGRELETHRLKPSATSLIVVPNPLLDHWKYQIATHVKRGELKVFVDDIEFKRELPCADELATYDVVITSFGRLTDEWKYRRPNSALEERRPDRYGYEDAPDRFIDGFVNRGTSPLLLVHWVRIIVDEGHKLGGTSQAYHMRMARLFHADKRWVMTGTPTPNTLQSADLRHMHGLLVFLRDRPYGEADGKAWLKAIARPFEHHERAGYVRLLHLLNRIMMRHTKESVRTLIPAPVRHTVLINPTPREYAMYNGVAAAVRANLVITNKDPHTPGKLHLDSLLNPIHRRWAKQVFGNLRLATCGGGQIRATLTRESFAETVNMLNAHGVAPERLDAVIQFMRKAASIDVLSLCMLCGRHLQLLMLVPCGHLACADCIESRVERLGPSCGVCNASYDWEIFQMLQPGFEFGNVEETWDYDNTPAGDTTTGTGAAGGGGSNGATTPPTARNGRQGASAAQRRSDGSTIPVRERHGNRQRIVPIDLSRFVTVNASKAFYVASRINELKREYERGGPATADDEGGYWDHARQRPKTVKAIIFSQFKEHIWRVKVALAQQGITCADFITGVSPAARMEGLLKFRNDPTSNVLVLTDVGSHGLDLSFVTHIFLMDEIWDKSLEKQVVARAHRMGARHSVVVEQLLMRASVEEIMHDMNKRAAPGGGQEDGEEEMEDDEDDEMADARQGRGGAPHSRALRGFFAGENKLKHGKRQKHKHAAAKKDDANSKSSMQHRQLQQMLESLRLIEERAVGEFGLVKFEVLDVDGAVVRAASLRLPNPGKPTVAMTGAAASPTTDGSPQATAIATATATTTSTSNGSASVARPGPTAAPSRPKVAKPVASASLTKVKQAAKTVKPKKQVRIKADTTPHASPQAAARQALGPNAVIDLTGDSDSDRGGATQQKPVAPRLSHSAAFYIASSDEYDSAFDDYYDDDDDSEMDDEWVPIERELAARGNKHKGKAKATAKSKGKGKGKAKRVRVKSEGGDGAQLKAIHEPQAAGKVKIERRNDSAEEDEAPIRTPRGKFGRVAFQDDDDDQEEETEDEL